MVVGGLTKLGLKCLDSISSLPVGEDWSAWERGCQRTKPPYLCAFLWSSWIAAGIFLVICVRRLPLLYCVYFGDLVYHLNKKLADWVTETVVGPGGPEKQLHVESSVAFRVNSGLGVP